MRKQNKKLGVQQVRDWRYCVDKDISQLHHLVGGLVLLCFFLVVAVMCLFVMNMGA